MFFRSPIDTKIGICYNTITLKSVYAKRRNNKWQVNLVHILHRSGLKKM